MSYARQVAGNTIVQAVGRVIATAISLATVAFLTRHLGLSGYGEYTTSFAYVALVAVFADFGFFIIMLREISKPKAETERIVSNVLTLRTILGILVFLIGILVAFVIPDYTDPVRIGIVVLSLAWLFMVMNSTFVGVFQVRLRMDRAVLSDLAGRIAILGLLVFIATQGGSLAAILMAYVVGNAINLLASIWLSRSFIRPRPRFEFPLWQRLFLEAWPIGVVSIFHAIYFRVDAVILSLMQSTTEVGIYGAPYKILEVLIFLPAIFLGNLLPRFVAYAETRDPRLKDLAAQAITILAMGALPIVVGGIILAAPILQFVAGSEYATTSTVTFLGQPATGVTVLQILMLGVGLSFFSQLFNALLIAQGRQRELIVPNLIFVLINVVGNLLLIPLLSYVGAALMTFITEIAIVILFWRLARQDWPVNWRALGQITSATLGMGAVLVLGQAAPLWLSLGLGVTSYAFILWLVGGLTPVLDRLGLHKGNHAT